MRLALLTLAALALATPAHAQFTGGVFGPVVKDGASSVEYRIAVDPSPDPEELFDDPRVAQRVHAQTSVSDKVQLRGVIATRTAFDFVESNDDLRIEAENYFEFDFVQAELTWQLTEDDTRDYQTGLRFDARIRGEGRPAQVGFNWMNQWALGDGWQARALLTSVVVEDSNVIDDLNLGGRAQLAKKLDSGPTVGLQLYTGFGKLADFQVFTPDTSTFGGPFVAFPLGDGVSLRTGALFGLSETAPDTQLRLWLTKSL